MKIHIRISFLARAELSEDDFWAILSAKISFMK